MTTTDGKPLFELLQRTSDEAKETMLFKCLKCSDETDPFSSGPMQAHAQHAHGEREFIVNLKNFYRQKEQP